MACIGKVVGSLAAGCGALYRADLSRPVSAKVLNASYIASFTVDEHNVAKITRVPQARAWGLTTINNALVITVGMKSQDIMPGAYDVSITFKALSGFPTLESNPTPMGVVGDISRAELVIAVDHGDIVRVYGLGAPLVCTEMSGDSSASAYVTYTYGVDDWQVGTTIHRMAKEDYDALDTPQPAPAPAV